MERKNYRIIDSNGTWVDSATITVYYSGTTTLASIFDDDGVTPKANPFTGPSTGLIFFYAPDGLYDIVVSGGTPSLGSGYTFGAEMFDDTLGMSAGGGGITSLNALTAASQTFAVGTAGNDFAISSASSTHTFNLPFASLTTHGKLSFTDWGTFNNKIGTLNGLTTTSQTLAIGSSGNSPSWASASGVHTLNLPIASATKTGILSSTDWTTFNNKQNSLSGGSFLQYIRGDGTYATLNTTVVPEGSNLYYSDTRVRAAISATSPVAFSGAGVISMAAATSGVPGYLTAADWTTFNNKISSVSTGSSGTDFASSTVAGAVTVNLPEASPTNTGGKITNSTQSLSGTKTFTSRFITSAGRRRYVRYHTAPSAVTVSGGMDDIIVVNKSTAGSTAVTLPAGPTAGDTYTIKDGKGDAGANNITVSPTSGNIDGSATNVISTNYLSRTYIYNGTEWNVIA